MENNYGLMLMNELADNPTVRLPICFCLDVSGSMFGAPINELNSGVKQFFEELLSDETTRFSSDIAIFTFGGDSAVCVRNFVGIDAEPHAPTLRANGRTPMGEAVNLALDMLNERKKEYRDNGVDYYHPWLVLMSDGSPNGNPEEFERAVKRTADMYNKKKLVVFPIGIGNEADLQTLASFTPGRPAMKMKGLKFKEFFSWLSKSVACVSSSNPGDNVQLPQDTLRQWLDISV